jgi:anti-sigma B factor antagonist
VGLCAQSSKTAWPVQSPLATGAREPHPTEDAVSMAAPRVCAAAAAEPAGREGPMNIQQSPQGEIMILNLSGKIMGGPDYEKFHNEIKSLINDGYVDILLNMSRVTWINSTGLGILVSAFHSLKKNGGMMKICEVSPRIDNILNVTQLKLVFDTYDSQADALASFQQG